MRPQIIIHKTGENNMTEQTEFEVETVSRTAKLDKVKLDILNRRQDTINAYKQYMKYQNAGHITKGLNEFKIELGSLYIEVRQMIAREIDNEKPREGTNKEYTNLKEIEEDIESNQAEKVKKALNYIS